MQETIDRVRARTQQEYESYYRLEFERILQDETTWVAETLNGPLEKDRIYRYRDGELYSPEGLGLTKIFEDSIDHYREEAAKDPSIAFQYRRSIVEAAELDRMKQMAQGKGGNTLVVVSTYPDELADADRDILGYQYRRKLGFVRVIKRLPDNQIQMWTHSFDGNDRDGIAAMYARMGRQVDWSRDVLEQVVELELDPSEMELYGDGLLFAYDNVLHQKDGRKYYAGRDAADPDTIEFVEAQSDLVAHHVQEVLKHGRTPGFLSDQRYDFAIAMRRRYEGKQVVAGSVAGEMSMAGDAGRAAGETASGCGVTVVAAPSSPTDSLNQSGYKVVDYKREMHEGEHKKDECMECPACKNRGVLIEKVDGQIYYTCDSTGGCGATTKPARLSAGHKEEHAQTETGTLSKNEKDQSADTDNKGELKEEHGEYAEARELVAIGGVKKVIVDRRDGFVLAA